MMNTTAAVAKWIEQVRPGCFVYADEMLVIEAAHRAFVDAGHECGPSEFRFALRCLGFSVESHAGGCRLVLDARVAWIAARGRIGEWYQRESECLRVTVEELESAILRGWTGDVLQAWPVARASEIEGPPPLDPETVETIEKLRYAPILPLRLSPNDLKRITRFCDVPRHWMWATAKVGLHRGKLRPL